MRALGKTMRVDNVGGVMIPKELRDELDIKIGTEIEFVSENDSVILVKKKKKCSFCLDKNIEKEYKGKPICKECIQQIQNIK